MKFYFSLAFLFLSLISSGIETTIIGLADLSFKGSEVYLFEEQDAVSNQYKLISKAKIDGEGSFKFNVDVTSVGQYRLQINRVKSNIFLAPGGNYNLGFPAIPTDQLPTWGGENYVDLTFYDLPKEDPNLRIGNFNAAFETFNLDNLNLAFAPSYLKELLAFWKKQSADNPEDSFSENYIRFACANAAYNAGMNGKKVFETFIEQKDFKYRNPEFGVFVREFFKNILPETDRLSGGQEIKITINTAPRAFRLLEELKKNDFLSDLKLREIVALHGLSEIFFQPDLNQENILSLIDQIVARSIYDEVKLIGANIKQRLTELQPGYPLPQFNLSNYNGEKFNNENLKGKPSLMVFWAPWSGVAVNELVNLASRQTEWEDKIQYVLVSVSNDTVQDSNALRALPNFNATKLSFSSQKEVVEKFEIKSIPHFILLDSTGNIIQHYAGSLSELETKIRKQL